MVITLVKGETRDKDSKMDMLVINMELGKGTERKQLYTLDFY